MKKPPETLIRQAVWDLCYAGQDALSRGPLLLQTITYSHTSGYRSYLARKNPFLQHYLIWFCDENGRDVPASKAIAQSTRLPLSYDFYRKLQHSAVCIIDRVLFWN